MKQVYSIAALVLFSVFAMAQNTVGLLSYDLGQTYQGYTLIYPHNQPNVYLLNNCGEVIHTWEDEDNFRPGNTAYLTDDGNLIKTKRDAAVTLDAIWAGGGGAIVEIRSWENELLWTYTLNNETARLHHDIAPMPNGNILMLAWERKTYEEAIEAGRDTALLVEGELWPDYVFEINPSNNEIEWEWHVWDHLVQDFDETKENYGVISENRRLVNLNYDRNSAKADWLHSNALDYNAELDQIMLSVPYFDEIWIIDHTTTTEEAASHAGGLSFRGGDLMSRIGNAMTYEKGDSSDQLLFFQHDAHWVNKFITQANPNYGRVVCFNNRKGSDFSTLEIFNPFWNMYLWDYEQFDEVFLPFEFDRTIIHPNPQAMYSTGLSSAQLLPNGNVLACSGRFGYIVELSPDNEVVWEYRTPLIGGAAADQGSELAINNNLTFRAFKYPIDYVAFDGRDLSPKGYIENLPNESYCDELTANHDFEFYGLQIFPNPADDMIHISWDNGKMIEIELYDLLGNKLLYNKGNGGMHYLDVSSLQANIYILRIDGKVSGKMMVR